jgi:hypothetical protein
MLDYPQQLTHVHTHLQNEEDISPVASPAAPSPASPFWRGEASRHSITGASLLSLIFFYHFIPNCFSYLFCSATAGANRRWSKAAAAGSGARGREDGNEGAGLAAAHGHSALDPNGGRSARSQDPAAALPRVHRRQRPREAQGLEKGGGGGAGTEAE